MQREKRMFRKLILSSIFVFCLLPVNIFAVGLGEIEQSSGLNQPLNAEIPLLSAGDLADYEVLGTLASNREFDKFGVEKVFFLNEIRFATTRNDAGEIIIKLTTRNPVKEPFLNFVIALNWPNGRILREYTLLLDPPIFEDSTSSTIEKTTTQQSDNMPVSRQNQTQVETRSSQSSYEPEQSNSSNFSSANYVSSSYQVESNDTLWSISSRARPDRSVSIQQALVAIYRANPDAFADGNINNLLKGKVLNIPDANTMRNVPRRAALQDVVMQNRQWRSGGARKIVDRTGNNNASTRTGTGGSRLSLAADDSEGGAQGYGSDTAELNDLKNDLARSQEEAATLQAENEALRSRLADILDKAENTQTDAPVEIEDTELAALSQASNDETSDDEMSGDLDDGELVSEDSMNEATDETMADDPQEVNDFDSTTDSTDDGETGITTDEVADTTIEQTSTIPEIYTPVKKELSFIDEVLANPTMLWGGIGGLVVLILLIVFWRMKKRMEDDEFHDDLVASAGAGSMDVTETFELPDVGDDMLVELDMEEDEEFTGEKAGESFDPLGEADIYIAYGKHEQAANILLEAIEDNPVRADLKVKLMECYAEGDDREKFEMLAEDVAESIDSDEWNDQINSLRSQAWGDDEVESSDDDFDLPSTEDIFGDDEDNELDIDFDAEEETAESDDDFEDIGLLDESDDIAGVDDGDLGSDSSDSDILDADNLGSLGGSDDIDTLDNIDTLDELESDGDESLDSLDDFDDDDFSLDMDTDDASDPDDISLDIDDDFAFDDVDDNMDFDENLGDDGDEIATKLDLARAYVDMGDSDGAKEILKEVISEGTTEQKSEAQALIDSVN